MIHLPEHMKPVLAQKHVENIFFKKHLRQFKSVEVDERIHRLYRVYAEKIDCTACGNCCKKLEPGIELHEIEALATLKNMPAELFKNTFVAFDGDATFLKTKPCIFLNECSCTIYENRPAACAGYPHLDQKDMKYKRSLWENYSICPIVFNVMEALKTELNFA